MSLVMTTAVEGEAVEVVKGAAVEEAVEVKVWEVDQDRA